MIAGWIPANDEHQIALIDILQSHRGRARSERSTQANPAGLMAIVAAVIDVVGAIQPSHQLQQESSFVAAPAAEIPKGLIGSNGLQAILDPMHGLFPGDRPEVAVAGLEEDWLDQSSSGLQLTGTPSLQFLYRVLGPEIGRDGWLHVGSHRLHRLLADLRKGPRFVDHTPFLPAHA
jgi:hypothetical protein